MELMDLSKNFLDSGRTLQPAQNRSVVGVNQDRRAVGQTHRLRQIPLLEELHGGYFSGRKLPLHRCDEVGLRQRIGARGNVPKTRMEPVLDISLERHDASRQTEYDEEDGCCQPEVEMYLDKNIPSPRQHAYSTRVQVCV